MAYSSLWLSVNALILDITLLVLFYGRIGNDLRQRRMFQAMLVNLLILNAVLFAYMVLSLWLGGQGSTDFIFSWLSSILITFMPQLFLAYLNSMFYYDEVHTNVRILRVTMGLIAVSAVLLFGPIVECADGTMVLREGIGGILLALPAVAFLTVGFIQGYLLKNSISKRYLWTLRGFFGICIFALFIVLRFRNLPGYGFLLSLCPLLAAFTLEGRGILVDHETGMRSRNAYRISVGVRLEERTPFRLILIHSSNLSAVLAGLDEQSGRKLLEKISASMRSITSLPIFRIREDTFAIIQDEANEVVTQEILIGLRMHFQSAIHFSGRDAMISMHVCVTDLPKKIRTMEDLEILEEVLDDQTKYSNGAPTLIENIDIEQEKRLREQIRALSKALQENRLEVFYQPILNTATGTFDSAEALVRMKAEDGSYVRPDQFIPAAERSGLIIRVGQFVLRETARLLSGSQREELGIKYIEANLSVEECIQENLPAFLESLQKDYQLTPDLLNIEVTESASDTISELMMHNMKEIHERLGFNLSLDDFGTGYSNLERTLTMPVEIVKFDRSMLLKAFETEAGRIVFSRMAEAVHEIGRKIVSEGVETQEQADFVMSLGIEHIQGFYYAKPMPEQEYLEFLRSHRNTNQAHSA